MDKVDSFRIVKVKRIVKGIIISQSITANNLFIIVLLVNKTIEHVWHVSGKVTEFLKLKSSYLLGVYQLNKIVGNAYFHFF